MALRRRMNGQIREERYREILVLHVLLEEARIDHRFLPYLGGFQITWPYDEYPPTISAIEHEFSYGSDIDLIELSVRGHVFVNQTAQNAFDQIRHHNEERNKQTED